MALETERSEQYGEPAGPGWLKSALSDGFGLAGAVARSLKQTTSAALGGIATLTSSAASGAANQTRQVTQGLLDAGPAAAQAAEPIVNWLKNLTIVRFFTGSLLRRILVSNLIGFFILVGGILYLGWFHTWLIDAKVDALKTQGKIIADAIATNAKVERGRIVMDPNKISDGQSARSAYRDDGFAALELSIDPAQVTPIVRKLIRPTDTRARIYARDGTLIVDTARTLAHWRSLRNEPASGEDTGRKPQNFWTTMTRWLFNEPLPVYKEIGAANGMAYREVGMAMQGEEKSMLLLNDSGEQIVSTAVPIRRFDKVQGVLLLSTRPGQIDEILAEERSVILALAAIALLASIVTSLLLARTVAGPMRRLSEAAEQVSRNITAKTQLPEYADRNDEVGQMAHAFGSMTGALYKRIAASEKFAADVAHELKNPLAAARSTAEALTLAKNEEQRQELVEVIQSELSRLNRLITDVSNASRLDAELARQQMRRLHVTDVLRNIVSIFHDILGDDSDRLKLAIESGSHDAYCVDGNDGRLGQVITNLVDNALSFSPEDASVRIHARPDGSMVEIAIEDDGPGIPEDRLEIVFDRFYTDRPATEESRGKNSGLGLSISREIVRSHGGKIFAENRYRPGAGPKEPPIGARLVVRLPIANNTQRGGAPGGRRS